MKRFFDSSKLLLIGRIVLGGLFIYAGILKMRDVQQFADSIAAYRMLPVQSINVMALALPPFEIILGLLLLIGWKTRMAALGVTLLLGIFTLALFQALLRGLNIDCGCFGSEAPAPLKLWLSLGRDLLLFGFSLWLWLKNFREDGNLY
jgi:uncharacterized membrane protein YphA (DoxX/SURF4 family)